jgi:DNA-binding PadR family transcriptional regulator
VTILGYAVLGLLAEGPRTGYDIARLMDRPIGYVWSARHSQIYPELARLEAAGLIRHRVVDGPGPRDTKRYRITAAGRRALDGWLDSPLRPETARSELLLRVRALGELPADRAIAFLDRECAAHAATLDDYLAQRGSLLVEQPTATQPGSPAFFKLAMLDNGISYERHLLGWFDGLLVQLRRSGAVELGH